MQFVPEPDHTRRRSVGFARIGFHAPTISANLIWSFLLKYNISTYAETNWFGITVFRSLADHALESFSKGQRIMVSGRLRLRQWEKDEKSGQSADIEADALGHDLRWGVSRFDKRTSGDATVTPLVEGSAAGASSGADTTVGAPVASDATAVEGDDFVPLVA